MAGTPSLGVVRRQLLWSCFDQYPSRRMCSQAGSNLLLDRRDCRFCKPLSIVAVSFIVSQLIGLQLQTIEHLQLYAALSVGISCGATHGLFPVIIIEWFGTGLYSHFLLLVP